MRVKTSYSGNVPWVPPKKINADVVSAMLEASLGSNHFTNWGPNAKRLEQTIREALGIEASKSVVCVSNGTVALWAAVAGLRLFHGEEIRFCTQAFTFPASALGPLSTAHIVDIDSDGGLDLHQVPDDCHGIIVTNVFGRVVDISKYERWSRAHDKFLIFDNAATPATAYRGSNACNYGHAATLSFHHTKPIGFGEGGCVIIDAKYEHAVRRVCNFGIDNEAPDPCWNKLGGNYKMSDLQAVYIMQHLQHLEHIKTHTKNLYRYFEERALSRRVSLRPYPNFSDDAPFVSCICIFSERSRETIDALLHNNINARKYYHPLASLPVAQAFYDDIVCIPCTASMNEGDIEAIVEILEIVAQAQQ